MHLVLVVLVDLFFLHSLVDIVEVFLVDLFLMDVVDLFLVDLLLAYTQLNPLLDLVPEDPLLMESVLVDVLLVDNVLVVLFQVNRHQDIQYIHHI